MRSGYVMLWALLALTLCTAILPVCAQEQVTFAFQPPDEGITLVRTDKLTDTKSVTANGETVKMVKVTVEKTKIKVEKIGDGYTWTEVCIGYSNTVDGKEQPPDPFDMLASNITIVYVLDNKGLVTAVEGYDTFVDQLREELDDEDQVKQFDQYINADKLARMDKERWNASRKSLLGLTKKPGETWKFTTNTSVMASLALPATVKTTFQKMDTIGGRPCAVLKSVGTIDLKAASHEMRAYIYKLVGQAPPPEADFKFAVTSYTDELTEYLDPTLMCALKEMETVVNKFQVSGLGRTTTTVHKYERTSTTEVAK